MTIVKTMLAVGLARKVAEAGHRTYFTNAPDLAAPRSSSRRWNGVSISRSPCLT